MDTTQLIERWRGGDNQALDELLPCVYADLRAIAARELGSHRNHQTLQPTALVNDVFVRLLGSKRLEIENIAHFFNTAARLMRQILVDRSRRAATDKRGGDWHRASMTQANDLSLPENTLLPELDEAITALGEVDERLAKVVELRCFVGLSVGEIAELLALDERTIYRDWSLAKAWLHDRLAA